MLILAADTSGKHGSVALVRCDADLLHTIELVPLQGGTFSAQLIPQVSELLAKHKLTRNDIEAFAVVSGPGSFTGLRVGLAAIKALAEILQKPIAALSLLEIIAFDVMSQTYDHREGHDLQSCRTKANPIGGTAESRALPAIPNLQGPGSVAPGSRDDGDAILIALDAGRNEAYVGEYRVGENLPICVSESLLTWNELAGRGHELQQPIYTADDTLIQALSSNANGGEKAEVITVPRPNAVSVARLGYRKILAGKITSPLQLDANYIRRADAEIKKPVSTPA